MGYVRVIYAERRLVIIDGVDSGQYTEQVIEVEDGKHVIKLVGKPDYKPRSRTVTVADTAELDPLEVKFRKKEA